LPPVLKGPGAPTVWVVSNKNDLINGAYQTGDAERGHAVDRCDVKYRVSAKTGAFLEELVRGLAGYANQFFVGAESSIITRQRHRADLLDCAEALRRAGAEGSVGREDIVAEELRLAARALGRLSGQVDVEHVLDVIFRDFCIGK
jgi:tRNA modification GTPase